MTNHPNRNRRGNPAANPTPEDIRDARKRAGLTQREAAALIYATQSAWEDWEQGRRRMHPALWELFRLKVTESWAEIRAGFLKERRRIWRLFPACDFRRAALNRWP